MAKGRTGPAHRFGAVQVWRALHCVGEGQPIGRKRLASAVGTGEGSMRTILGILLEKKMVRVKRAGVVLSAKGRRHLDGAGISMAEVDAGMLTLGPVDAAVHLKGNASNVNTGLEQRDEAIKAGAMGATTVVCRGKQPRLVAVKDIDLDKDYKAVAGQLRESFLLEAGDVVVISTARDKTSAENGAVAAAFSLFEALPFNI